MKLRIDREAAGDLEAIFSWISADNPLAADYVVGRILESVQKLATFPLMGRIGSDPGTRERVIPGLPYVAVYELDAVAGAVVVTAFFHAATDRP